MSARKTKGGVRARPAQGSRGMTCRLTIRLPGSPRTSIRAETALGAPGTKKGRTRGPVATKERAGRWAGVLAALGHPVRMRLVCLLLDGPATYEELTTTAGMRSGPLYFHIQQLRQAGLIAPRQRDRYELSRTGLAMGMLVKALLRTRMA